MTIRIGIAGFGSHASGRILPVIEGNADLSLAAVWTRSESTRAQLRERGHTGITGDFEQFLASELDVVYVASATGLHFAHAAAVLQAGHHAWVEKPIATRFEEVGQLVAMAETGGLMLTEAFMFPWHAQAEVIRRALADGRVGELRFVSFTFCFPHLAPDNFRYDPARGGGAFLDHGCYLVKALDVYLGGRWTVLGGCMEQGGQAVDVSGAALLRRETDGAVASLRWGFGCSYINEIEFVGDRGRLLVNSAFTKPASRPCDIILEDSKGMRSALEVPVEDPYRRMIEGFVQQFGEPGNWHGIREDLYAHAGRYFGLHGRLKQCLRENSL